MSWPGENEPNAGGSGRGRRRRSDSPPEDPYLTAQNPGGTGRHGSGEYERPQEYVARAEQEAVAYDQYAGYAEPTYYQQQSYETLQNPYAAAQDTYGVSRQDTYAAPQQDTYTAPQDAYATPQDAYVAPQTPPYGASQNLNSSGFYSVTMPAQPSPPATQPSFQPAPQPSFQPAPPESPQPSFQPMPQQPSYQPAPAAPAPVQFEPEPETEPAAPQETVDPDREISHWLNFLEGDNQKAEHARRLRFRLIALGVVFAVLGAGAGLWYFLAGDDGSKATETTVLLQIKDQDGNAVDNVVLVAAKNAVAGKADPAGRGAALLVPSQLSVSSGALDAQPFGGAMPNVQPAGKDALSNLIGVDVDGVWSMDALSFASFLDQLTGITVDLDPAAAAAIVDPKTHKAVFTAGKQQLTGTQAAVYATYRPQGESPDKQLARFGQVLDGMLTKMPQQASTTVALLNGLATVPDPALPNDKLGAILTALGSEWQGKRFGQDTLPVTADGSGTMDLDPASKMVKDLLGGAARSKDNGGLTRVAVGDATGRSDTVSSRAMAASKLLGGGYTTLDQGVLPTQPTSYVEVPDGNSTTLGKQVALALGLADTAVKVVPFDTTLTDARVVLGQDWTQIAQVPADQVLSPTPTDGSADGSGAPTSVASGTKPTPTKTSHKPTTTKTH